MEQNPQKMGWYPQKVLKRLRDVLLKAILNRYKQNQQNDKTYIMFEEPLFLLLPSLFLFLSFPFSS